MHPRQAALALVLAVFILAPLGLALPASAATSQVIDAGSSYNVTFVSVDVTANSTVTFKVLYIDSSNQTTPYLTLSGTSFSFNASAPMILAIENTGTAPVNVTFNTLSTELASSAGAKITPTDQVVRIPVAVGAGGKIRVTLKSLGDPWLRQAVIILEYADGTYEVKSGGMDFQLGVYKKYSQLAKWASDADWPAGVDGDKYYWVSQYQSFTFDVPKDLRAVIVAIATFVGSWEATVDVIDAGSQATTTTTTTSTGTAQQSVLAGLGDIMGGNASGIIVILLIITIILLAAVLLRGGRR